MGGYSNDWLYANMAIRMFGWPCLIHELGVGVPLFYRPRQLFNTHRAFLREYHF